MSARWQNKNFMLSFCHSASVFTNTPDVSIFVGEVQQRSSSTSLEQKVTEQTH